MLGCMIILSKQYTCWRLGRWLVVGLLGGMLWSADSALQPVPSVALEQLPDVSFVGYRGGTEAPRPQVRRRFRAERYGVIPDDGQDDRAAIQRAIDAAAAAGGGVVTLPAGRLLMWTDPADRESLRIRHANVVLRGAGSGSDGTTLYQVWHGLTDDDGLFDFTGSLGTTRPALAIGPERLAQAARASLAEVAERHSRVLTVAAGHAFRPGMLVSLRVRSTAAVHEVLGGRPAPAAWTRLRERGVACDELHRIAAVNGNRITLATPLHMTFRPEWPVEVVQRPFLSGVGVEDLRWQGGWLNHRVHHRSAFDDTAWRAIRASGLVDSWIRNVSVIDGNEGIYLDTSSQVSISQIRFVGNAGHSSIHVRRSTNVWVGDWIDATNHGYVHGPGCGYGSAGVVYWRGTMHPQQSIDCHSGAPYATVIDTTRGGRLRGNGGPLIGFPNHGRWFVAWNFHHGEPRDAQPLDLSVGQSRDTFIDPALIGLQGQAPPIATGGLGNGVAILGAVTPTSLWQHQLTKRLGREPRWLTDLSPMTPATATAPSTGRDAVPLASVEALVREVAMTPMARDVILPAKVIITQSAETAHPNRLRAALLAVAAGLHEVGLRLDVITLERDALTQAVVISLRGQTDFSNDIADRLIRSAPMQAAEELMTLLSGALVVTPDAVRLRLPTHDHVQAK